MSIHGVSHQAIAFDMLPLACDCHTHVFGPFALDRVYTPGAASVASLLVLQHQLKLQRVVIVQPSPYGSDNACTVAALRELGSRGRGVAVIDTATSDAQLQDMHAAGVCAVRLNLETGGVQDPVYAGQQLRWASARVAALGWHLQLYTNLALLAALQGLIRELGHPLVVDHFGGAKAALGIAQPHFDSDWPHPGARPGVPRCVDEIEAFNPVDDGCALNRLAGWAGGALTLQRILVDNPAALYQF